MLKVTQAYVVRSGRLVGVLTRDRLTDFVGTREKKPMDRCCQLLGSCVDCFCCGRRRRGGEGALQNPPRRRDSYPVLRPVEVPMPGVMGGGEGMV